MDDALSAGADRCPYRWIVDNDRIVGAIALRHETNDFTKRLGHVGYGIRPSARRQGFASLAVGDMLEIARRLGMLRVLLVCGADNIASASMIERIGGTAETTGRGAERRYWIDLGPAGA